MRLNIVDQVRAEEDGRSVLKWKRVAPCAFGDGHSAEERLEEHRAGCLMVFQLCIGFHDRQDNGEVLVMCQGESIPSTVLKCLFCHQFPR
jgi:hypothetical protein